MRVRVAKGLCLGIVSDWDEDSGMLRESILLLSARWYHLLSALAPAKARQ